MNQNPPPGNWQWSPGEASRPLVDGGYYLHIAILNVWSNQHARRYYECRIDTVGMPPTEHVLEIELREEDDIESVRVDHKVYESVDVEDPEDESHQKAAEELIHQKARMHMEYYTHD